MDEGRKRVLLIAASIFAARKLQQVDGVRKVPSTVSAVADGGAMGGRNTEGAITPATCAAAPFGQRWLRALAVS